MSLHRDRSGFSLVELLIVFLILGTLIAVITPQYLKYIDKSREVVCAENMAEARSGFMLENVALVRGGKDSVMDKVMTELGAKTVESGKSYKGLCPAGGIVTVVYGDGDNVVLTCSKHNHSTDDAPTFGKKIDMDAVIAIMKDQRTGLIDSQAALVSDTCASASAVAALAKSGLDLNAMGASMWRYNSSNNVFIWSTQDVSTLTNGQRVPVIRYNASTGTYTVWIATAETGHTTQTGSPTASAGYTVLSDSGGKISAYTPSTKIPKESQTYENALKYYQQALDEMAG